MKICRVCKQSIELSNFYKIRIKKHDYICKKCDYNYNSQYRLDWGRKNKEKLKERRRLNKDKNNLWNKIWRQKNSNIKRIENLSYRAFKNGLIKQNLCQICGEIKTEMHHPDYKLPLNVIWVCKKHHVFYNQQKRNGGGSCGQHGK